MKHHARQFDLQLHTPKQRTINMNTALKRNPTYQDTDTITFGKYFGEPLSDIPAQYLRWLWTEAGYREWSGKELNTHSQQPPMKLYEKIKLANYIWNSQDEIAKELGEEFP